MEFQKIPMNKCGIYMITSPSGKSYIGRSLNLKERLNKYKNLLCSEQQGIYHAILKYGWENMTVTILYSEDRNISANDLLNKLEIEFISKYNTLTPNGYNLKSGGNQPTLSDITKQRMSESAKGRLLSEEHKRKLSIAQNKDWVKEKKSLTHRRRVVQLSINGEVIKEWYSITEVSKTLGVNASGISHACKNGGKSHEYRWKYIS